MGTKTCPLYLVIVTPGFGVLATAERQEAAPMPDTSTDTEVLLKVSEHLDVFRSEFIECLEPVQPTTRSILLRIFEVWRQANLRRLVDLGDSAHLLFSQGRLVPGCTLTRALFETVGVQYYIHKKMVDYTDECDPESIHILLGAAIFGRKDASNWPTTPIQVLTAIDHMDKEFTGSRSEYDHLCEYAHPNLKGGFGTYVYQSLPSLGSKFGLNPQALEMRTWGLGSLNIILIIASKVYGRLDSLHPKFVSMAMEHAPNHPR